MPLHQKGGSAIEAVYQTDIDQQDSVTKSAIPHGKEHDIKREIPKSIYT